MSAAEASAPIDILLVEDNPGDVRLTMEAMREAKVRNQMHTVGDGVEAMAYLRKQGSYANAPRPHLILLDLNLPKKDGRSVLAEVKADPDLRRIPVVVLTTSSSEQDVRSSYDNHVNCYITKPVDFEKFLKVVKIIDDFWIDIVTLPSW